MALKYYQRRMWCEELHGDIKDHGFDLESTMLHDFLNYLALLGGCLFVCLDDLGRWAYYP